LNTGLSIFTEDNETLRLTYLDAMGIDCWVLKEYPLLEDVNQEEETVVENVNSVAASDENRMDFNSNANSKLEDENILSTVSEKTFQKPLSTNKLNYFLKMVNWSNSEISQNNVKNILIICRHQIDQPSNSFATSSAPSHFMLDYISALASLLKQQGISLNIQLAHLSTSGIGETSQPIEKVLNSNSPDLILLLGNETVSSLVSSDSEVSALRGQLINLKSTLKSDFNALVSYHPFSLISNPSLKSLALEDMMNLVKVISISS